MQKVFISVGMNGRPCGDVLDDIARAKENITHKYGPLNLYITHNYDCKFPDGGERLYCLGEAIKKLGDCDACYFVKDWEKHKGCLVEYLVCKLYGIEIIVEV